MRALVIFDSRFGNTETIARALGEALSASGWETEVIPAPDAGWPDCSDLDLVVFGGPTQRHGLSPAMNALLSGDHVGRCCGVAAAAFDTRYQMARILSGSAAEGIAARLEALGCHLVANPESFYVAGREGPLLEGELERARAWAVDVAARVGATTA
jgi:flavorubredoxin